MMSCLVVMVRTRCGGGEGDDLIDGGAGDDILVGDADGQIGGSGGNDILVGGAGNDTLVGGGGQDTYLFESGDGIDVIVDAGGEGNRLVFGAGISPKDIVAAVGPNDSLVIRTGFERDEVQIWNFGTSNLAGSHPIDTFEFSDGTIFTYGQLSSAGLSRSGGVGNDHIVGRQTATESMVERVATSFKGRRELILCLGKMEETYC